MLVLTRGKGEKIRIGPDIEVVVVRIGHDKVRLGIAGPDDVLIARAELPLAKSLAGRKRPRGGDSGPEES